MKDTIQNKAEDLAYDLLEQKFHQALASHKDQLEDIQLQLDILRAKRAGQTVELDVAPDNFRKARGYVDKCFGEIKQSVENSGQFTRVYTNLDMLTMPEPPRKRRPVTQLRKSSAG